MSIHVMFVMIRCVCILTSTKYIHYYMTVQVIIIISTATVKTMFMDICSMILSISTC